MSDKQLLRNSDYDHRLLEKAADSKLSFHQIDTPGWSSMVRTETASDMRPRNSWNINEEIQSRFNGKDISNLAHDNSDKKNKNIFGMRYSYEIENMGPPQRQTDDLFEHKNEKKKGKMRLSERIQLRLTQFKNKSENGDTFKPSQSSIKSQISSNFRSEIDKKESKDSQKSHPSKIIKALNKNFNFQSSKHLQKESRFKEITVHEHLYQMNKKIEKKKELYKIIEEKYEKEFVTTFSPSIDFNSIKIAEIKFNSVAGSESKSQKVQSKQAETAEEIKKKTISQDNQKTAELLFEELSLNSEKITQKTLNEAVQTLPLSCVRLLQKIIKNVYKGVNYSLPDFKSAVNDKTLISNKPKLVKAYQNYRKLNQNSVFSRIVQV